ncbi:ribonuclease H-like domain-containing protein [Tanacetum coccineum]
MWDLPRNGNSEKRISTVKDGVIRILPPVTAVEIQAVEKEMKAKNILLMTIPKEHMRRFHGMDDAKEIWEAIRTRSMPPPAWSNLAMTMRTKPDVDTLSIDDITNKVKSGFTGAYSTCTPSTSSTNILEKEALAGFADEGEHTEDEETNHALMAISSSSEVSLCSKTCIDSYNTLKTLCDEQMNQLGSIGTSSVHSVDFESEISRVPQEVYVSKPITTNEKGVSAPKSKEVEPSCVTHIKTPRQPIKDQETPKVNRKNWNAMMERELGEGYSFTKKKCFVCGSLSHLIKDCDYYEKKMAREAAPKKQRVFNTGNRVTKPVWNNADRINHANYFVPRSVILNSGRPNVNSVRQNVNSVWSNINTGRTNVNSVRPRVSTVSSNVNTVRSRQPVPTRTSNSFSPKRPQVNQFNQRKHFSKSYSPVRRPIDRNTAKMSYFNAVKGNWGSAVKTSAGYNWRPTRPNSNCNGGPTFIRTDHPLKNMVDRGIFDSGCSGHMTGNKDQLEDFEEFNGGSVTFGGSKGYITGKGRNKSWMPDERSYTSKGPLVQHTMYSFDMKTPTPAKSFACLIAKATSDESKMSHRRLGLEIIRSDNGTEFKNRDMLEFCGDKRIKQEYSNARTLQQNGVAERMNRTLIKAARTMLADSLLPTTF